MAMENLAYPDFLKLLERLEKENDEASIKEAIFARCATDIELFAKMFFPHYCVHPFNKFHYDTFKDYTFGEQAVRRASSAPRGYAKSTIKVLIKPIHDVCYKLEKFIVIASNTEPQSSQKLKDISSELITNESIIDMYGKMLPNRKVGATDFITNNDGFETRFLALGAKTEARGIRFREARPSKIICDDVEHSTEVESEALREKMEDWYKQVISKIGDENTSIEFVGTVLHRKSLLKSLVKNPKYQSREYKAVISWADRKDLWANWQKIYCDIDNEERQDHARKYYLDNQAEMDKGVEVLWPEKEPYYALQEEIIETGMRAFMKEKQNSPLSDEEKVFNQEDFHYYEVTEDGKAFKLLRSGRIFKIDDLQPLGVIDPSTGQVKPSQNKKTDWTCILSGFKDPITGRVFVHHDYTKRTSPTKYIKELFELNAQFGYHKFGIETNLFRGLLKKNILDEKKLREKQLKKQVSIKFYDIIQTENKQKRIYTLEPKVFHGYLVFNKHLSNEFFDQIWEFPKASHDDCPDALEMLWGLANNKYKTGALNKAMDR
jgi:predicted phage terminase large subunit-like protein